MQKSRSPVPWWLKAGVFTMFGLCLIMGAILVVGLMKGREHFRGINDRLTRAGYEKIAITSIVVTNPPARPTWYLPAEGDPDAAPVSVEILNGSGASLAIFAATGIVHGVVRGDVLFVGRTLILEGDAIIESNLETTCWMVQNFGQVRGEMRGTRNYFTTNRNPMTRSPPQ